MTPEILQRGVIEAESSRTTGSSKNAPPGKTYQQHRHQLVHHDAAIVSTKNMTQDAHLKIEHETGSTPSFNNKKQHTIRCDSIHSNVDQGQVTL